MTPGENRRAIAAERVKMPAVDADVRTTAVGKTMTAIEDRIAHRDAVAARNATRNAGRNPRIINQ